MNVVALSNKIKRERKEKLTSFHSKCHVYKTRFVAYFRTCLWWLWNIDAENIFSGANNEILQYSISYTRNTSAKIPISLRYHIDNNSTTMTSTQPSKMYLFGRTEDAIDRIHLYYSVFCVCCCCCHFWISRCCFFELVSGDLEDFCCCCCFQRISYIWMTHDLSAKMIKKSWLLQFEL